MWGIFLGSLLFVVGLAMAPIGLIVASIGLTLALIATARYAVDMISPAVLTKKTIYDDMGIEPTVPEQPIA